MLDMFARRKLDRFEKEWSYDVGYLREVLECGGIDALMPMAGMEKISSYRRDIPPAPYFAAKIVATRHGDCGPCLQLGVKMALRAGVPADVIRNVLANDTAALPEDVALTVEFTQATLRHDPGAEPLRARIEERWGKRAVISLSYGIAGSLFYPAFKYALGFGHACSLVHVGDLSVKPAEAPRRARPSLV